MLSNPRVELPKPRPQEEERTLMAKELMWEEEIKAYIKIHCNNKGDQLESNLTKQQKRGLAKLRERAKSGEIVITCTDKSNGFAASTRENYRLQGAPHVAGDKKVTWTR